MIQSTEKQVEEWRPVVGYEGRYVVSNFGRVASLFHKNNPFRILNPGKSSWGYPRVNLAINRKCRLSKVHKLVAMAFIPNPENKTTVNHKDLVKTNNHVDNLEWMTRPENQAHYVAYLRNKNALRKAEKAGAPPPRANQN